MLIFGEIFHPIPPGLAPAPILTEQIWHDTAWMEDEKQVKKTEEKHSDEYLCVHQYDDTSESFSTLIIFCYHPRKQRKSLNSVKKFLRL